MSEYRWVVNYTHPDCIDDNDLIRSSCRAEFNNEDDAIAFANEHRFKNKPSYWQPVITKEESYEVTTKHWKEVK